MITLKTYQENAVQNMLKHTQSAFTDYPHKRQIPMLLKAPTGAGKTVTMAAYLSRLAGLLGLEQGLPQNMAFIWLAPNTLHLQSYAALQHFYSSMRDLRPLQVSDLSGNSGLASKELLFLNWSSVDKERNTFRAENESNHNLTTLIENTYAEGTEIMVIIDEAHYSAFSGVQAQKVLKLINAKIEISVTATPAYTPDLNTIITRQSVVAAEMIKKGVRLNPDLNEKEQRNEGDDVDTHILKKAMATRDMLAQTYKEAGIALNPLLLIQLPSEKVTKTEDDETIRLKMETRLSNAYGINTQNGRLAIWLSDSKDKINLDDIEEPEGLQDVLIFKQAISQGWDCPRAAVIIIFREIGNPTFGIQTVGRILRMPHQKHYTADVLNYGYVYTNLPNKVIKFVADDMDYFSLQLAVRKENLLNHQLDSSLIINDRPTPGFLTSKFKEIFFGYIEQMYGVKEIPEKTIYNQDQEEYINELTHSNREAFQSKFWNLNVKEIEIQIPTNITVDQYEMGSIIDARDSMGHFVKSQPQLKKMLEEYAYYSITRLNRSKSWKLMYQTLIEFVEYYMSFSEYDARKILLYPDNNALLTADITQALENYDVWQKEQGNKNRRIVDEKWEIPQQRYYSDLYKKIENIEKHALVPFYEAADASKPEQEFVAFLEKNKQYIDWWYKNGDKGPEHFAIPYQNMAGEVALFYVDFIIRFKSGTIGIFDTKSRNSDPEAPNKHNALLAYIEKLSISQPKQKLIGGVIIAEVVAGITMFRYAENRINDTIDFTGWTIFNPANF